MTRLPISSAGGVMTGSAENSKVYEQKYIATGGQNASPQAAGDALASAFFPPLPSPSNGAVAARLAENISDSGPRSSRESAVALARKGFRVFPISREKCIPIRRGWFDTASSDPDAVKETFTDALGDPTGDNVAILTGDSLLAVDVDHKVGPEAQKSLDALVDQGLTLETLTTSTPSGGLHLFYRVPTDFEFRNKTNWRPGIDIRGHHGLVVAPGSVKPKGVYAFINDLPIVDLPQVFIDEMKKPRSSLAKDLSSITSEYEDAWSLAEATKLIQDDTEGGAEHDSLVKLTFKCFDLGITPQRLKGLIEEHWPLLAGLDGEDHEYQIDNCAERFMAHGKHWGRDNIRANFEPMEMTEAMRPRTSNDNAGASFAPTFVTELRHLPIPPREWLIEDHLARRFVTLLISPGGIGKTQYIASLLLSVVTGRAEILDLPVSERTRVWLWNQEDENDELKRRLKAVMAHFGIEDSELVGDDGRPMLAVNSGVHKPFMLARRGTNGAVFQAPEVDKVVAHILSEGIGLFVIDPLAEFHEAEENDNVQMRAVWGFAREIATRANCVVLVAAHSRKPGNAAADGHAGNMDSLRGASSQTGVARIAFTLHTMTEKEAKGLKIKEDDREDYTGLRDAKGNIKAKARGAKWFRWASVDIGEESIGVFEPVSPAERTTNEKPDIAALFIETLTSKFGAAERVRLGNLIDAMTPDEQEEFGTRTNRSKTVESLLLDAGVEYKRGKAVLPHSLGELFFRKGEGRTGSTVQFVPASSEAPLRKQLS